MTAARAPQWPLIARALVARGKIAEGLAAWRKAAVEAPSDPAAWASITMILSATAAGAAAATLPGRIAVALAPLAPAVQVSLASALAMCGDTAGSARAFRRAIAIAPDHGLAQARLGHVAADRNQAVLGLRYLLRAAAIDPMDAGAWAGAAWWHFRVELAYDRIELALKRALASQPAHADALDQMGELFRNLGELATSLRFYDRCLAVAPSAATERALLLALLYASDTPEEEHFGRHLAYARRYAPERPRPPAEPLGGRRIRLGYLSSGFCDHPTAALTVGLIEARDRERFEVSLFANIRGPDAMSRRLKDAADSWTDVHGLSHEATADRIRDKRLDILVHPAGRHDELSWSVAALRPAPIQVALYEAATTGIAAFDYLVTDRILTPPHSTERMVERPLRLPSLPLHELPAEAPPVSPLPAVANGYVTFGSLNNSAKLNDGVLALWARTLAAVPGSRILIKAQALAGRRLPMRIFAAFDAAGVAHERIELVPGFTDSRRAMLQVYDRIDIGLDTLPWSGGMTTFEAMCQGVPVVTIAGRHLLARWGATLLVHAGHPGLVAESEQDFIEIARRLAADMPTLARMRARLRDDFLSSPLCNARLKARHLERAYRHMVRKIA